MSLIHEVFNEVCLKNQSNTALILENGYFVSFKDLQERTDKLAAVILESIFQDSAESQQNHENFKVSILTNRGIGMIVAIIGTLKSGGSYIPVDPTFPADRQSYIFKHSKSVLLIVEQDLYALAKGLGVDMPNVVVIDEFGNTTRHSNSINGYIVEHKDHEMEKNYNTEKIAYVLYTSGSTGKPKGVMVKHHSVINTINYFKDQLNVSQSSRVLGLTTYCFDISVLEMFLPLLSGGTLVIASSWSQKDPFRLLDVISSNHVNIVQATPTTYEMMIATGWSGDLNIDFLVGGEAFRPSLIPLIKNSKSLRNVYGPTETTIWSSCYDFQHKVPNEGKIQGFSVPIGTPISQTVFYVVVDGQAVGCDGVGVEHRLAGAGEEGELWIGGAGVASGYLNAPELTQQRFLRDPFLSEETAGMVYRTGDLVKQLDDGNYMFIRRMDDQVKLNGYRIELAEIEMVLASHPAVEQVVTVVKGTRLVGYVKLRPGHSAQHNEGKSSDKFKIELLRFSEKILTSYMIPKQLVIVASFSLTSSGKLDRNALPSPPEADLILDWSPSTLDQTTSNQDGIIPSEDIVEEGDADQSCKTMTSHILDVIQRVRGHRPKPTSSLGSIGIDSLGAAIFVRALSESLGGIRIETHKLFTSGSTINTFAEYLYKKVLQEKPEVLSELHIVPKSHRGATGDIETGGQRASIGGPDDAEGKESLELEDQAMTTEEDISNAFDDVIMSNKRLLDGVRGILALMVLWDHYGKRQPHYMPNIVWHGDTSLFVILSGFSTSLLLRPMRAVRSMQDAEKHFDWRSFLFQRFVGVFPVLWLTLILNAPRWYYHDIWQIHDKTNNLKTRYYEDPFGNVNIQPDKQCFCVMMYIIGMQLYFKKRCAQMGPFEVYYACDLWNCFIFYSVFRFIFEYVQKQLRIRYARSTIIDSDSLDYEGQEKPTERELIHKASGRISPECSESGDKENLIRMNPVDINAHTKITFPKSGLYAP